MNKYSLSYRYWESVLGRDLKEKEINIIKRARCENEMNQLIFQLAENIKADSLYIPTLTENDGNCLFQSLCYNNISNDVDQLKKSVSNMMLYFKKKKNFIPDQDMTLEELFSIRNENEYVYCNNTHKLYKYTYDAMCIDLMTDDGWKRIETELLLTVLSIVLNIKFRIYHDNGHITDICPRKLDNIKTVYLAQLGEFHYLPLELMEEKSDYSCPFYQDSKEEFERWAKRAHQRHSRNEKSNDAIFYHKN